MDVKGENIVYHETKKTSNEKSVSAIEESLQKLLKIAISEKIDLRIRLSAVEQLAEFSESFKKPYLNIDFLNEIKGFVLETLRNIENYIEQNEISQNFIGKVVLLGNNLAMKGDFQELKCLKNKCRGIAMRYFMISSIETRFQIAKFLQIQIFLEHLEVYHAFNIDFQEFFNSLQIKYHILIDFRQINHELKDIKTFWNEYYPVNENIKEYLEKAENSLEANDDPYIEIVKSALNSENSIIISKIYPHNKEFLVINDLEILENQSFSDSEIEEQRISKLKMFLKGWKHNFLSEDHLRSLEKIAVFVMKRMIFLFFEVFI